MDALVVLDAVHSGERSASALERDAKQGKSVAAQHVCHRANRLCSKKSDGNESGHSLTGFELRRSVGNILLAEFVPNFRPGSAAS
jgi:hypothetical protein